MRVAVAVGGQLRMSDDMLRLTYDLWRDAFPTADIILAVWSQDYAERSEIVDSFDAKVEIIEEYDIHYHPYEENRDVVDTWNFKKKLLFPNPTRHLHQTKQILNHNKLMKKYGSDYDVVVRTRFDSITSPVQNFEPYLRDCYENGTVISIQDMSAVKKKRKFFSIYNLHNPRADQYMVFDGGLVIHSVDRWKPDLVEHLHNTKKLLAAEFGWWQVLVGDRDVAYKIYDGGAQLTRCVKKTDIQLTKEWMNK